MKITRQSATILELSDSATGRLMLGVLSLLIGVFVGIAVGAAILFARIEFSIPTEFFYTPVVFIGAGLYFLLLSRYRTTLLDKDRNMLVIEIKGWFGNEHIECPLSDIARVDLRERIIHDRDMTVIRNRMLLVVRDGTELSLNQPKLQTKIIFGESKLDKERELAKQVATFIGVPFRDDVAQHQKGDMSDSLLGQAFEK